MNVAFDYDSRFLTDPVTNRTALPRITLKRGFQGPVVMRVVRNGVVISLPEDASGVLGILAKGDFGGSYLASAASFVKAGTGANTTYTFSLNIDTAEIAALFPTDATTAVEVALEILITSASGALYLPSETVPLFVNNAYIDPAADPAVANPDLKATQAEAEAGADNVHWMSPLRTAQAIAVLSPGAAHNLGSIGAAATQTLTLDLANGSRQYGYVANVVNALTLAVPIGTAAEMDEINFVIQWSDGITLAFHADIGIPTDSAITLPKTLTAWRSYRIKLEFFGGRWNLVSLVGGFTEVID